MCRLQLIFLFVHVISFIVFIHPNTCHICFVFGQSIRGGLSLHIMSYLLKLLPGELHIWSCSRNILYGLLQWTLRSYIIFHTRHIIRGYPIFFMCSGTPFFFKQSFFWWPLFHNRNKSNHIYSFQSQTDFQQGHLLH